MENCRNQQFTSFKLCAESCDEISCCPASSSLGQESPFVQHILPVSHLLALSYQIDCHSITGLVFKSSLCGLIMALKHKSSDAGNLGMWKRNCQVLLLSEKVKCLDLIRKGKNLYAEVTKIYDKS